MPFYETVFIARQDLSDTQVKDLIAQFSKIITDNGGKIHKTEHWGLRTLAYRIKKSRRAHYALIESDAPAPAIHEMERRMRLNEEVLRYLTVREEALSTGPSAILDRGGREDYAETTETPTTDDKEAA
ncbi:MAG: 30S ribosomal protein S6 [Alphaproteobacteria bacterium]|nr:30S ribosomal protein S6 [Alphaproteobacteria bacterium]MBP7758534.1 30S ribosomal protein S6 [Alphaproteobacteria bacterium]MBP7761967.1 30S ribosomal protein S6 [Alphaproteobacteria bacterium]MBP7905541.1 30S ribosomal protein S6 [Alphaproteobacteria bacterium]